MHSTLSEEDEDFPATCLPEFYSLKLVVLVSLHHLKHPFGNAKTWAKDQRKAPNNYHNYNQHNLGDPNLHLYPFNNPNQGKKEKIWGFSGKGN